MEVASHGSMVLCWLLADGESGACAALHAGPIRSSPKPAKNGLATTFASLLPLHAIHSHTPCKNAPLTFPPCTPNTPPSYTHTTTTKQVKGKVRRPQRPDDAERNAQVQLLQDEIAKLIARQKQIKEILDDKHSGKGGTPEQQKLREKLQEARGEWETVLVRGRAVGARWRGWRWCWGLKTATQTGLFFMRVLHAAC